MQKIDYQRVYNALGTIVYATEHPDHPQTTNEKRLFSFPNKNLLLQCHRGRLIHGSLFIV